MKSLALLAVVAGLAVSTADAIQLVKKDVPRVIGMDIVRKQVLNPRERDRDRLRKRQSKTVTETLDNEVSAQYADQVTKVRCVELTKF